MSFGSAMHCPEYSTGLLSTPATEKTSNDEDTKWKAMPIKIPDFLLKNQNNTSTGSGSLRPAGLVIAGQQISPTNSSVGSTSSKLQNGPNKVNKRSSTASSRLIAKRQSLSVNCIEDDSKQIVSNYNSILYDKSTTDTNENSNAPNRRQQQQRRLWATSRRISVSIDEQRHIYPQGPKYL